MKRLSLLFFTFLTAISYAQILEPAHWSTSTSVSEAKVGDEIDLIFTVAIDDKWYLYSTDFPCEDGPLKTEFTFKPHGSYTLVGKPIPINPKDKHDKIFECDVKIFEKKAEFRQRVKILAAPLNIAGEYSYQVCTEIDGSCIPGDGEFTFNRVKVTGGTQSQKIEQPKQELIPVDTTKAEITPPAAYSEIKGQLLTKVF